jgi:CRP-like cAMP-binding protein
MSQNLEVLRASSLLSALDEKKLAVLAQVSRLCSVVRGETIWGHGSEVDFFGVIHKGFVQMVRTAPTGVEATIEVIGPTQVFGLLGTLDNEGCPLRAEAMTDVSFLRVPKMHFRVIYESSPRMKEVMMQRTIGRLRSTQNLLALLSGGRVEQRISAILLTLARSYGEETTDGVRLQIPITRQELAQLAGTTIETAIRTMSRWQKEGLVTTRDHHITLHNPEALRQIVEG